MVLQHPLISFFGVTIVTSFLLMAGCGQKGALSIPLKKAEIRFYSINEQQQQRELLLVPGAGEVGCHNLPLTRTVYRVAQIGFSFCKVFAENNCPTGSEYNFRWPNSTNDTDKIGSTAKLTPGAKWLFTASSEVKVRSWSCRLD